MRSVGTGNIGHFMGKVLLTSLVLLLPLPCRLVRGGTAARGLRCERGGEATDPASLNGNGVCRGDRYTGADIWSAGNQVSACTGAMMM